MTVPVEPVREPQTHRGQEVARPRTSHREQRGLELRTSHRVLVLVTRKDLLALVQVIRTSHRQEGAHRIHQEQLGLAHRTSLPVPERGLRRGLHRVPEQGLQRGLHREQVLESTRKVLQLLQEPEQGLRTIHRGQVQDYRTEPVL